MATPDITAPLLVSISRTPGGTIDLASGSKTITIKAKLTDDLSGVSDGINGSSPTQIRFVSPSGDQFIDALFYDPVSGNRKNGDFEGMVILSPFAEAGTWKPLYMQLYDEANNLRSLDPEDVPALKALAFAVTNPNADTESPLLKSISRSKGVVDIDAGEKTITITGRFTDDRSGLFDGTYFNGTGGSPPQIRFVSPDGQIIDGLFDVENPVSGNIRDGQFRAKLTFDENADAGEWKVQYLLLNDEAGNLVTLDPDSTPALDALSFTVKNGGADTEPPTVDWVSFGSPTLNDDGTTNFVIEARLRDNLSGLSDGTNANGIGVSPPQIRFKSASGQFVDGLFEIDSPLSGTAQNGVFRAVVTLGPFAETGVWNVEHLLLNDEAGNIKLYSPATSPQIPPSAILLGTDLAEAIEGGGNPDAIYGFGGNDDLGGGNGGDTLNGGDGDDEVDGGAGDDEIVGGNGAGNDKYVGGAGFDTAVYKSAAKTIKVDLRKGMASGAEIGSDTLKQIEGIVAGRGNDTVKGGKGNNVIDGYAGKDKVTGGAGKDAFVFSTELGKKNVDTIRDFKPKDDIFHLDDGVFEGLSAGKLKASAFAVRKAKDAGDRIIYDDRKGVLSFDANGSKKGGATAFAKVGDHLDITHKDFLVI